MINKKLFKQFSNNKEIEVKGVTIHNTNNSYSAKENLEIMLASSRNFAAHVFIDENEVIEALPTNIGSFHTGKAYDNGNLHTISVEICRSICSLELYLKAQKRAIDWIKDVLEENGLDNKAVFFHNDFDSRAYCPHRIFEIYGNKRKFIEKEMK